MDINRIPELAAQREERANQAFVRLQRELAEITLRRNETLAMCEQVRQERDTLKDTLEIAERALRYQGYRKSCDIAACNCGDQWQHGGHANERLREISDALPYADGMTVLQRVVKLRQDYENL